VYEASPHDHEARRRELRDAREKLEALVRDLHAIDAELEDLCVERRKYRLLHDACSALEELRELDAADLFWGTAPIGDAERQIHLARSRCDGFEKRLVEVEDRRLAVLEAITIQDENADVLAAEVLEAEREEELRKLEWKIERELETLPTRPSIMPWVRGGEEDDRFRKALAATLLISLLLGLLLPMIDLPIPDRWETSDVPDRLTRLIREARPVTPIEPKERTKPVEPTEESSKEPEALAEKEAPKTPRQEPAAKGSGAKGILAFREKFSALAKSNATDRLGAKARVTEPGEAANGAAQLALISTRAAASSGGIDVGDLSRRVGGGGGQQIEGVQIARVTSSIGGSGTGTDRPLSDGPGPSRTDEEIQIVFDRHKAALYRLYNRELRKDPTLKGQMILRITIEPDGSVSLCQLKSTDMDSPMLSSQVLARVQTFDFGAKEGIPPVTILYPIDFLPAT
jgi:hypothetical protein